MTVFPVSAGRIANRDEEVLELSISLDFDTDTWKIKELTFRKGATWTEGIVVSRGN
jgi:hypothetical protein